MSVEIEARRIHVRHPSADRDALRDVTLVLQAGEILALVGPNGSGKSTLLAALGRELSVREGSVTLDGTAIAKMSPRRLARRVARLPQDPETPEGLRVEELVALGRYPHRGFFASLDANDHRIIGDALNAVSLTAERKRQLETLSGGERRRAWLAMVLAQEPEVLLLDEPTASLDLRHQFELLALLRELNTARQVSIVASLHDLEQAASLAHRMAIVVRGRIYAVGKPADVVDEEMLLDVFGVEARVSREPGPGRGLRIQILGPGDPLRTL